MENAVDVCFVAFAILSHESHFPPEPDFERTNQKSS